MIDPMFAFLQCSVLLPVVLTLISTQNNASRIVKDLGNFCYPKWALEAFVIANSERYATTTTFCCEINPNQRHIDLHWNPFSWAQLGSTLPEIEIAKYFWWDWISVTKSSFGFDSDLTTILHALTSWQLLHCVVFQVLRRVAPDAVRRTPDVRL